MLRQGSEQTEPAGFSGSGREGRMVQTSCVCHCDFKIISPTPLAIPRLFHPFELSTGGGSPAWIFGLELGFIFDLEKCFSSSFPPRLASTISFHFRRIYIYQVVVSVSKEVADLKIYIYTLFHTLIRNIFDPRAGTRMLDTAARTSRRHKHSAVLTRESRIPLLRGEGNLNTGYEIEKGKVF